MVSIKRLTFASIPSLALASSAVENSDSPSGSSAVASFPDGGSASISGDVTFKALTNGSVEVVVDLQNLPSEGGPFGYHIHEDPVPSNGSCTATLGHLNPNNGSKTCGDDISLCELGDLSGKHGTLSTGDNSKSYVDPYLSLNSANDYFIAGSRSITIHYKNTSRLACANIVYKAASNSSNNSTTSAPVSTATDSAGKIAWNGVAVLAGVAALLM